MKKQKFTIVLLLALSAIVSGCSNTAQPATTTRDDFSGQSATKGMTPDQKAAYAAKEKERSVSILASKLAPPANLKMPKKN